MDFQEKLVTQYRDLCPVRAPMTQNRS